MSHKKGRNKSFVSSVQIGADVESKKMPPDKPRRLCLKDRNNILSLSNSLVKVTDRDQGCVPPPLSSKRVWSLPKPQSTPITFETKQIKKCRAKKQIQSENVKSTVPAFVKEPKLQSSPLDKYNEKDSSVGINNQRDGWRNKRLGASKNDRLTSMLNDCAIVQPDVTVVIGRKRCDDEIDISRSNDSKNLEGVENNVLVLKMKKLQIKEEKRRKREEDIRRRMIAPKSQHFKVISHSVRDKIMAATDDLTKSKCVDVQNDKRKDFELNRLLSEFPDLNISCTKLKKNNSYSETDYVDEMERHQCCSKYQLESVKDSCSGGEISNNVSSVKKMDNKHCGLDNECWENNNDSKSLHSCEVKNKKKENNKKKVKKNDPIEFSLTNALEMLQKKQKTVVKSYAKKRSVEKKRLFSGNELDSACPMRKKGKYQENGTKKKLTRIKRLVLNERQRRTDAMNEFKLRLLKFGKMFLNGELDCGDLFYHLVKTKKVNELSNNADNTLIEGLPRTTVEVNDCNKIDAKVLIHSRRFRFYCNQWPNEEMNKSLYSLIKVIVKFQDRQHYNDPIKAHAKRRYACGFNEVLSYVKLNKAKLVVIATDINCKDRENVLFDCVMQVTESCESLGIPYVFGGSCRLLRSWFKKRSLFVSFAAILNYDGAEGFYKTVIDLLPEVKRVYNEKLKEAEKKCGITREVKNWEEPIEEGIDDWVVNIFDFPFKEDVTSMCIRSMLNSLSVKRVSNIDVNNIVGHDNQNYFKTEDDDGRNNDVCPFMSAILKRSNS